MVDMVGGWSSTDVTELIIYSPYVVSDALAVNHYNTVQQQQQQLLLLLVVVVVVVVVVVTLWQ